MIVNVGPGAKARYFVGICASGLPESSDSEQIRYYSPWKVYTDGSGMPLQVKTILDGSMETFYSRALVISDSEVVYMLQCGMSNASACSLSVTCGNEIRSVSMANFNGFLQATDIKAALSKSKTPGNFKNLVLNDGSRYTIFMVFNKNGASDIVLKCKRNTGGATKILADNVKASVVTDHGFKDMVQTILALGRMPDTVSNPVNYTGPLTVTDDKQEKLVVCAMLFNALAHVSPIENRNEVEQGVFSNYIQFADSVVRGWSGLTGSGDTGFIRLEKINNLILAMNKGDLADPVYVKNNGTLSDYGKSVKERKNYAFYEGYTRLDAEISYSPSGSATLSGAGVMFRVSDNIEVYAANIADTFNMFKEPFIPCTTGSRRIIIKANDSLWGKLSTDGIWVKGKDEGKGDQQYYIGISKVRLPLKAVGGAKPVGSAFKLGNEGAESGDPVGMIVGGAESNFFKMYTLIENPDSTEDTIINNSNPEILLHHQRRIIEIDSNYIGKEANFKFDVIGSNPSDRKIYVESETGYTAVLKDTSQEEGKTIVRLSYKDALCYVGERWMLVSKIFSDEAKNGNLRRSGLIGYPYEIKTPLFFKLNMIPEMNKLGMVVIKMPDRMKIYTDEGMQIPWGKFIKQSNGTKILQETWGEYQKMLNSGQSLFFEPGGVGKETVTITVSWPSTLFRKRISGQGVYPVNNSITENITFFTRGDCQIVLEPITNEVVPGTLSEVYNPVCVVVGNTAYFKIEITRPGFTPDMVTWTSKNSNVKFVDGYGGLSDKGSGLIAKVRGVTTGEDQLIADIQGYDGIKPRIDFSVVTPKNVNLFTYIVKDDEDASVWTHEEIDRKIDTVNSILKQIGVTLIRNNGTEISKSKYFDINTEADASALVDENRNTGGLEVYFNRIIKLKELGDAHNNINRGIVFPKLDNDGDSTLSAREFAHEIMHSARQATSNANVCYFLDIYDFHRNIYDPNKNKKNNIIAEVHPMLKPSIERLPNDFGKFFKTSETQISIMKKLLEYGYIKKDALDIPRGDVYGLPAYKKGTAPIPPVPHPPAKRLVECGYLKIQDRVFEHQN